MPEPALSAKNMSIKFGSKTILDNISIDIHAGQVTTLLGPNGAGKSTLLKALCRELSSNADIEYFGHSMTKWSPQRLAKHLAMLPQNSTLTFPFLVHEVVELGGIPLGTSNKELNEISKQKMGTADVSHLSSRLYPSLSGGEKQRVHLARVLTQLHHADEQCILMLDEPTSALDLAHQHNTLKIARDLADTKGAAVIVVLHDLNLAAQYSDRLVVLKDGELVCDGSPWEALKPQMIEEVYGYSSLVEKHPTMDFPQVHPAH
ncbi:heme ABC transporter ATP-binding protein [Vibrio gallaecicus]|uniref:Heme ABC transporter ATP-binding protein n=1 Tax=Vibrio gallaecicus TaxID=552386 RepID=A0ABV4NEB5_9VIBR|nr:heme ABC transporter ATP-binding protein [Vibrio gallaecicus]MDN3616485.1 heme ABC transporter ATP-binding protein [Vibrio gallaecicus]